MKIAIVTGTFPALSESFVLNHVVGLIQAGHEVQVFSNGSSGGKVHPDFGRYHIAQRMSHPDIPRFAKRWARLPALLCRSAGQPVFPCLRVLRDGLGVLSLKAPYVIAGLADQHFDLLHCHFGQNGLALVCLRNALRIPLVTSFHGGDLRLFGRFSGRLYRKLFRAGDAFVANSGHTAVTLQRMGCPPEKIVQIPALTKDDFVPRTRPVLSAETARLLSVARLEEMKGIQHCLQAVRQLHSRGYPLRYTVVGDGSYRAELERLARRLEIAQLVDFTGWKDQQEVYQEYARSDIFILPSITGKHGSVEAQGLVIQEAQLHGLPVVASRSGGISEGVAAGAAGLLFQPGDPADLACQISKLLDDRPWARRIGAAGEEHRRTHYSCAVLMDRLLELYRSLIDADVPGPAAHACRVHAAGGCHD
jgi:colanic acid/amylovoran biosynthesis glycosyltransferase